MLKKTITYKDLDDNDVTEDFWFNLSQAEMTEMALSKEGKQGGFDTWIRTIQNSNDGQVIMDTFKKILLSTVGERSEDNKRFLKSDTIRDNFQYSNAYDVLFMEVVTDAEKMSAFINGVVPAKLREQVDQQIKSFNEAQGITAPVAASTPAVQQAPPVAAPAPAPQVSAPPKDEMPAWYTEGRVPTEKELVGASSELMMEAFRRKTAGGAAENGASS